MSSWGRLDLEKTEALAHAPRLLIAVGISTTASPTTKLRMRAGLWSWRIGTVFRVLSKQLISRPWTVGTGCDQP